MGPVEGSALKIRTVEFLAYSLNVALVVLAIYFVVDWASQTPWAVTSDLWQLRVWPELLWAASIVLWMTRMLMFLFMIVKNNMSNFKYFKLSVKLASYLTLLVLGTFGIYLSYFFIRPHTRT